MITTVDLTKAAQKDLESVPRHVVDKLLLWVGTVERLGLEQTRKYPATTTSH